MQDMERHKIRGRDRTSSPQRSVSGPPAPAHAQRRSLRVLLVEDNEDHALLARRALERRGHTVTAAPGPDEALAELEHTEYDVVAVDYQLPGATGLEVLQRIAQRAERLPVVMVTASGSEQVAVVALKRGARDYVVKSPGYERELARALELAWVQARAEEAEAALREEVERRARTDHLTGLLNRGEMERTLQRETERARRYGRALSFGLVDIDGFKVINDTLGHPAGDAALRRFARILEAAIRASDAVARWGGDEFAVLLVEAGLDAAEAFAGRLHKLVREPVSSPSPAAPPPFTVSVGFVVVDRACQDVPALLRWADRALYAAKDEGRACTRFFTLGADSGARPLGLHGGG